MSVRIDFSPRSLLHAPYTATESKNALCCGTTQHDPPTKRSRNVTDTVRTTILVGLSCLTTLHSTLADSVSPWTFFAYESAMRGSDKREFTQAVINEVAALGYGGVEFSHAVYNPERTRTVLGWLDAVGLKPCSVYQMASVSTNGQVRVNTFFHKEVLELLRGRDTIFWVASWHNRTAPENLDQAQVEAGFIAGVTKLADELAPYGLRVGLYNHWNHWLENPAHAYELARKINRPNVGVTFNLFHYCLSYGLDDREKLEQTVRKIAPLLFNVNINGSKAGVKGHNGCIRTLDDSDFDLRAFLRLLKEVGFRGPIGTHGVSDLTGTEQLERSAHAWKQLMSA